MSNNETVSTRVITVRLRVPALALMAVILVGGLVWAFVLGIMVGRGQINDQLEALMPQSQDVAETNAADKSDDEVENLIKAEDLKYQESLRQNQTTPADPVAPALAARNDSAQNRPAGQKFNYLYQVASYNKEEQAGEMLAKLRAKGVDAQMETKTIQNTLWFRVLVSFQGDESNVQSMQDMLKKDFKITSIMPRSKTPLGR